MTKDDGFDRDEDIQVPLAGRQPSGKYWMSNSYVLLLRGEKLIQTKIWTQLLLEDKSPTLVIGLLNLEQEMLFFASLFEDVVTDVGINEQLIYVSVISK